MIKQMKPIEGEDIDLPESTTSSWGNLTPEELDHKPFKTGRFLGRTPSQIAERYPAYIVVLYENTKRCSKALYLDCLNEAPNASKETDLHSLDFNEDFRAESDFIKGLSDIFSW